METQFKIEKHEKLFVLERSNTINDLLEETFKSSQRIKLVCFDVSKQYIVFGANNGSIHIYRRGETTEFVKLIPSKNSAALERISISPNEENVVVTDETGLILILEDCFSERNFYSHLYPERKGKKITATKWDSDTKVYIGDNEGTVSVVSVRNIVSLALLHTPYVSLMDLDAPIVQIDTFSRFMLITAERKTFICDTEREMYKQVGRKDKGKGLGACFYNPYEGEIPQSIEDYKKHRLYCTRPGMRMWQANFEGEVLYTHKYKNAVPNINEIIRFGKENNTDLKTEHVTESESGNFGNILVFNNKYLCVLSDRNVYIIDPENNDLLFNYYSSDPIDVRLVDHEIYIWNLSTGKLRVFNFHHFENLMSIILKLKQYKVGIQLIVKYKEDILNWSKVSPNIKLVTNLESELSEVDNELGEKFKEILKEIIDYENERLGEYRKEDDPKIGTMHSKENIESESEDLKEKQISKELKIMYKQYKLNESNGVILIPQFTNMLLDLNENDMSKLFLDFIDHLKSIDENIRNDWCYSQYLYHFHLNAGYTKLKQMNAEAIDFLTKSFLGVNKEIGLESACSCTFPLPSLVKTQPKFDNIGRALSEHSDEFNYLFGKIPHLWFHRISKLKKIKDVEKNLPLILQFGYVEILKKFRKHVTYDLCDSLIDLFARLKKGNCLNCGKAFPDENCKQIPDWEYLGLTLIQFIGADNVLKLFLNRHEAIPKDELSERFYMTCMFSKIQANSSENSEVFGNRAAEMASNLLKNGDTNAEFKGCLRTFIMGKVDKTYKAESMMKKLTCSSCSYCKTLLNHPVLNQVEQLDCGHAFHAICLRYTKRVCNVCFSR